MQKVEVGQTIKARGREWTAVTAPKGDDDLIIADPHLTEEESARVRKATLPHGVSMTRAVLDLSEIAA